MSGQVQLIGLDWGTSNLRAYLYDTQGRVVDTRQQHWGIRHLPEGGYPAAMRDITAGWPPCITLAAGMIGSRQGWIEVPYVDVPADMRAIAKGMRRVDAYTQQPLWIAPGLHQDVPADVMRGEETQILGALALQKEQQGIAHFVLPGTHSKWVTTRDDRITTFRTFMTGEMYALMINHSILGAGIASDDKSTFPTEAFAQGVQSAKASGVQGAWSRLFSSRALMLRGELAPEQIPDFLSGLLIGEEFRVIQADASDVSHASLCLIGDDALCHRYTVAAEHFGYAAPTIVGDAASYGLWELARHAGLLAQAMSYSFTGAHA